MGQTINTGSELRIELPASLMLHIMGKFYDTPWYGVKYDDDTKKLIEAVRLLTELVELHKDYVDIKKMWTESDPWSDGNGPWDDTKDESD